MRVVKTRGASADEGVRATLVKQLHARRGELEGAILARVRDPAPRMADVEDVDYLVGMRAEVAAVVRFNLTGIERGEDDLEPIPAAAVVQAHRAARIGVTLGSVLRHYLVAHTLLWDFVVQEADQGELWSERSALRHLLKGQRSLLDRLMGAIACEYLCEVERLERREAGSAAHHRPPARDGLRAAIEAVGSHARHDVSTRVVRRSQRAEAACRARPAACDSLPRAHCAIRLHRRPAGGAG